MPLHPEPNFPGLKQMFLDGTLQQMFPTSDKGVVRLPDTVASFPFWRSMATSNKRADAYSGWSMIVDIDGCLANWNEAFFDLLVNLHGHPPLLSPSAEHEGVTCPRYTTWDWPKTECGYTQEQIDAAWDEVDEAWWYELEPYPGAQEALRLLDWLDEAGKAQVTFCTGRYPTARNASRAWLARYGFDAAHVLTTSRKGRIAAALAANGPVATIEDKPSLITEYGNSEHVNIVYAIDQPYNRDFEFSPTVERYVDTLSAVKAFENQITLEKW